MPYWQGIKRVEDREIRQALCACRTHIVAAGAFSLGINLLYLAIPLYMLQVYDRVLASGSTVTLVMLTLACLLALLTLAALDIVRARVLGRSGLLLEARLAARVVAATVESANRAGNRERPQGLRDLDTFRQIATGPAAHALFDAPWAPIYIAIIFLIHPLMGLLALACAIGLTGLAWLNESITSRAASVGSAIALRGYSEIDASARHAEAILALGMLQNLTKRWLTERRHALALQLKACDRGAWISGTIKFSRLFMQALMLGLGAYLVIERSISAGAMIAAAIILGRALQPVEQFVGTWRQLIAARDALMRLTMLLKAHPPERARVSLPKPQGKLTVDNVGFLIPETRKPALSAVRFDLEPGEALGVIGPTAAGKSTLARLVVGVQRPTGGVVRLDGADVCEWNHEELGRYVGYMPQNVDFCRGSVAENIARFGDVDSEAVTGAAVLAGAHEVILGLVQGYETWVGDGAPALSGGQRQRIALARALYGNPCLVVLDEPNSNLDAEGETALGECLRRLKERGTTVIVISHRLMVLNCVDKIMQLNAGVVEAFGPRDEFLARLRTLQRMQPAARGFPGRGGANYA